VRMCSHRSKHGEPLGRDLELVFPQRVNEIGRHRF
jgi:hypothetical protein